MRQEQHRRRLGVERGVADVADDADDGAGVAGGAAPVDAAADGLAAQAADFLKSYGYNVAVTGNAPAPQATTALYDYTGGKKPYTVKFLANRFGLTAQTRPAAEATDGSDIKLILGANFKTSQIAK